MSGQVVVITGGVGGAKLVLGLMQAMPPERIIAIVNTGDDFEHLGLSVSPDIDTLLYTLSGKANAAQGWGREGETWSFMDAVRSLGGEDWFALGDGDLALHILRTASRARGETLSVITARFARAWDLAPTILPMSDDPVATFLDTDEGELAFQAYFVARRCAPVVRGIAFRGAAEAQPGPGVCEAILADETDAILIAPSNPFLSVDPVLAIPGISAALAAARAPIVAISPIVGGTAVKGPTAKLMGKLGNPVTPAAVAEHYRGIIDAMLVDERDVSGDLTLMHLTCDTLMTTLPDRRRVAEAALELARRVVR